MLEDVIALLDRKYSTVVARSEIADFLLHLAPFVGGIDREPRLRMHLDDMVQDAERVHARFNVEDRQTLAKLKKFCRRIPRVASIDDHPADDYDQRHTLTKCKESLERALIGFDERLPRQREDAVSSRSLHAIQLLRRRLRAAYPTRDTNGSIATYPKKVNALFGDLDLIERAHRYEQRRFSIVVRTAGTFAAATLRGVYRQLNPPLPTTQEEEVTDGYVGLIGEPHVLRRIVHGGDISSRQKDDAKELFVNARDVIALVYDELRTRIGAVLSLRALMLRFKVRAEAYDHDALRAIANGPATRKEDRLADRLAAFLFDQGLSPLTRSMVSGLIPDIIAPDLYVEAKQYANRKQATANILSGARQIWSTGARLRGTKHEVTEAYLVVFRRGGPLVIFDDATVKAGGLTLHPLLIDVAPNDESGSRQKEDAVTITGADLLAERALRVTSRRGRRGPESNEASDRRRTRRPR